MVPFTWYFYQGWEMFFWSGYPHKTPVQKARPVPPTWRDNRPAVGVAKLSELHQLNFYIITLFPSFPPTFTLHSSADHSIATNPFRTT